MNTQTDGHPDRSYAVLPTPTQHHSTTHIWFKSLLIATQLSQMFYDPFYEVVRKKLIKLRLNKLTMSGILTVSSITLA